MMNQRMRSPKNLPSSFHVKHDIHMKTHPVIERKFSQLSSEAPNVPWWRVSVMWVFFVGGLGGVVVASFALLFTAISNRDAVLPHDAQPARVGAVVGVPNTPTSPAMQARNHAATPPR
jgi:hypothetical protein